MPDHAVPGPVWVCRNEATRLLPLQRKKPMLRKLASLLPVLLAASLAAGAEPRVEDAVVKSRDNVELATTVYLPAEGAGPWPCVLARTPYNKDGNRGQARDFTKRGYAYVAQDCRGRFKSKGEYAPFRDDGPDGYDTVEWIAAQSWSNGKVGMAGGSALGITSHLAATQVPPHLVCAYVVVAESSARRETVYQGGVYRKELNDGWLTAQGALATIKLQTRTPPGAAHWDWREMRDFHSRIRIPIQEVGGWFDIFTQGTLDSFSGLQANGAGLAAGNQRLVMGPWAHGQLGGRLKFPNDRAGDFLNGEEVYRWFDRWLKGDSNGVEREPPVRYYLLGDPELPGAPGNEWRTAISWPPPSRPVSYFLRAGGSLSERIAGDAEGSSSYTYDPKDPVATAGGGNLILGGKGPMDQRVIKDRQDYLRFMTAPLETAVVVVGRVWVDLYVSSDAPDTDFTAKLVDVYPDGYEALLCDGILRARYREGLDREVPLEAGKTTLVRIDLWSTAIAFARGHRIAVHVSSSNDPRFDPNPNTGKPLRADAETRTARNTIHHDAAHPSRILLPILEN